MINHQYMIIGTKRRGSPMRYSKSAQLMKKMRKGINKTQQQLALDMFQSREYISKQEVGERKIPPVSTKYFIERYNSPWLALEVVNEYIGWGLTPLEDTATNNNRYFHQLIVEKELKRALEMISKVNFTKDLNHTPSMDLQDIHRSAEAMARIVHFSTLYLATICEAYHINWLKLWKNHHNDLRSKRYLIE